MEFDNTLDVPLPPAQALAVAATPNKPVSGFTLVLKTLCAAVVQMLTRKTPQS